MDVTYRIVFAGQLADGTTREAATEALAKLFRKEPAALAPMFDGRRVILRKSLPAADKERFLAALARAGLVVTAEAEAEPAALSLADTPSEVAPGKSSLSLMKDDDDVPATRPAEPAPAPAVAPAPQGMLSLSLEGDDEPVAAGISAGMSTPAAAVTMRCPSCGQEQPKADVCAACGVVIEKFLRRQAEKAAREAELAAARDAAEHGVTGDNPYEPGTVAGGFNGHAEPEFLSIGFDGRIGRVRFLAWNIGIGLVLMLGALLSALLGAATGGILLVLLVPLYIAAFVYMFRLVALRLHDRNLTGWLGILLIVPMVNIVFGLLLLFMPGDDDGNDYGAPPSPPSNLEKIGAGAYILLMVLSVITMLSAMGTAMNQMTGMVESAGKLQELAEQNPEDISAEDMFGFQEELIQEMEKSGAPPEMIEEMRAQLDEQRAQFEEMQADGAFDAQSYETPGEEPDYEGTY